MTSSTAPPCQSRTIRAATRWWNRLSPAEQRVAAAKPPSSATRTGLIRAPCRKTPSIEPSRGRPNPAMKRRQPQLVPSATAPDRTAIAGAARTEKGTFDASTTADRRCRGTAGFGGPDPAGLGRASTAATDRVLRFAPIAEFGVLDPIVTLDGTGGPRRSRQG